MGWAKMLGMEQMVKWIVIGIVAIILIVIFFWQFSQFFIPLILTGMAVFILIFQSMQTKKPVHPALMVSLPLCVFIFGYFVQRISTVALSGFDYSTDPTGLVIDQTMSIMLLIFLLVIVVAFAMSRKRGALSRRTSGRTRRW